MTALLWALLGLGSGAIAGSFLATLILRWPQGRSIARGRSACDGCGRKLGILDLVPLLGGLLQRGRCRICGARIDPLHWRVELLCAVAGAAAMLLAPGLAGLSWAMLAWFLITLAILDWRHYWLPDLLTLPLAFLGFSLAAWATDVALADRAIGAGIGYGALALIAAAYRALRSRDGLGLGDAKLLGALGAWFGWQVLPFLLLFGSLLALLLALWWKLSGRPLDGTTRLPFGTFLCAAAFPAWLAAQALMMVR